MCRPALKNLHLLRIPACLYIIWKQQHIIFVSIRQPSQGVDIIYIHMKPEEGLPNELGNTGEEGGLRAPAKSSVRIVYVLPESKESAPTP